MRSGIVGGLRVVWVMLCLGLVFQWWRCLGVSDMVGRGSECFDGEFSTAVVRVVISGRGSVEFWWNKEVDAGKPESVGSKWIMHVGVPATEGPSKPEGMQFAGFYHEYRYIGDASESHRRCVVMVPYWLLVGLAGVWPVKWVAGVYRRVRRAAAGCCQHGGYDLRGGTHQCPERGQRIFSLTGYSVDSSDPHR